MFENYKPLVLLIPIRSPSVTKLGHILWNYFVEGHSQSNTLTGANNLFCLCYFVPLPIFKLLPIEGV